MKTGTRTHGPASLKLSYSMAMPANLRGGLLEVSHVLTPESDRGQGHASRLIEQVCAEADAAGKLLLVRPLPFDVPELTQDQLTDWYLGFGFLVLQENPVRLLVRRPGAPNLRAFHELGEVA